MNFRTVNVSTGPVNISKEVQKALVSPSISHRSQDFNRLYADTTALLSEQFNVRNTHLLTGSGTAANEAMIWQIKMTGTKGLILSNGEFGSRLIEQANRASLEFVEYKLLPGETFDKGMIEKKVEQHKPGWLLFCHCETSTGVVNDLDMISKVCYRNGCLCFADCMSTVGTHPLDLTLITMATASSGKGLASFPGLAIIFSNKEVVSSNQIPMYFDLGHYSKKGGIPFTISSNLVNALNVSVKQKLQHDYYQLIDHYSELCWRILSENKMLPFDSQHSKVFTVSSDSIGTSCLVNQLAWEQIILSYESEYLQKRDLCQLAFFGYYHQADLDYVLKTLRKTITAFSN